MSLFAIAVPGAIERRYTLYGRRKARVSDGWVLVDMPFRMLTALRSATIFHTRDAADQVAFKIAMESPKYIGRLAVVEVVSHKGGYRRAKGDS